MQVGRPAYEIFSRDDVKARTKIIIVRCRDKQEGKMQIGKGIWISNGKFGAFETARSFVHRILCTLQVNTDKTDNHDFSKELHESREQR